MEIFTLQDWTTIRGASTTPIVQTASSWLDCANFADVVFWLEVSEVANPAGGNVSMIYETAPIKDEPLFQTLASVPAITAGGPTISKAMMNACAFVPLARFVRWKLQSTAAGAWDVTFRIQAACGYGVVGAFSPLQLPGLALWLRADRGITLNGSNVSGWADLSGNGNDVSQSTTASQPPYVASGINGRPAVNFLNPTFLRNTATNLGIAAGSPYSVFLVAMHGSGPLFCLRLTQTYSATRWQGTNTYVYSDGVNNSSLVTVFDTSAETNSPTAPFKSATLFQGHGANPFVYLNGTNRTITSIATAQTTENGTTGFIVGADISPQCWGGLISEVIVCTGTISDFFRKKVEGYQRDFFGF